MGKPVSALRKIGTIIYVLKFIKNTIQDYDTEHHALHPEYVGIENDNDSGYSYAGRCGLQK
jgi:hypothetical protein